MSETYILIGAIILIIAVVIGGTLILIARFYRKVEQGKALIINKLGKEPLVTFTGGVVYPIIHKAEEMDISLRTLDVDRRGSDGLICKDNIRADIKVNFFIKVNKSTESVLQVAQNVGCNRASDIQTLNQLFLAKFSEALKTAGKKFDFVQLYTDREDFRDEVVAAIGPTLGGYSLEDVAIDYLEQTPLEKLDPDNILDAEGIKKITEITTGENVKTNDLKQTERKAIRKQNVEADEAVFSLDRQRADAEAKRDREIATVKAREHAQTLQVQAEERSKAERSRIKADEEIQIEEENKLRQIAVAQKNRERIVAIEHERVEKDRQLEALGREHDVELRRYGKDKAIEGEMKEIADKRAERISVEKSMAEQEEGIKDLRLIAEAKRTKEARVITAQGAAEELLVKEIKAAEASEEVAKFTAKERLTLAEADREAADKHAQAKIRLSEGIQAEVAAEGLAAVRVKEADAVAVEKVGQANANVTLGQMQAEAKGEEEKGFAEARIKEAIAGAREKEGLTEAKIVRETHLAHAKGAEEKGLAEARVREADAAAIEKTGLAEAVAIEKKGQAEAVATRERLQAEASGLAEKANAMKALDGVGRDHEEFRLRLDKAREVQLAEITARKSIAHDQAQVLGEAFAQASINIVGGDGQFFDQFMRAVTVGRSIDGLVDNSNTVQNAFQDYLGGDRSLPADLKDVLQGVDAGTLQSLSLSALLARLATNASGEQAGKLQQLAAMAQEMGLDKLITPESK